MSVVFVASILELELGVRDWWWCTAPSLSSRVYIPSWGSRHWEALSVKKDVHCTLEKGGRYPFPPCQGNFLCWHSPCWLELKGWEMSLWVYWIMVLGISLDWETVHILKPHFAVATGQQIENNKKPSIRWIDCRVSYMSVLWKFRTLWNWSKAGFAGSITASAI